MKLLLLISSWYCFVPDVPIHPIFVIKSSFVIPHPVSIIVNSRVSLLIDIASIYFFVSFFENNTKNFNQINENSDATKSIVIFAAILIVFIILELLLVSKVYKNEKEFYIQDIEIQKEVIKENKIA